MDVGTGSGRWAIEVGDQFPNARVRGIDLSPIKSTRLPENVSFIVMDLTKGLDFDTGSIDLVHSRYMNFHSFSCRLVHSGIKEPQWPAYIEEIYRVLRPYRGCFQMTEFDFPFAISEDNSLPQDSSLNRVLSVDNVLRCSCLIVFKNATGRKCK